MAIKANSDLLRSIDNFLQPDPRSADGLTFEPPPIGIRSKKLEDHIAAISEIGLALAIPEKVRIQYDTARNLYLYAWFAYRFFPVAEHHVLTCLELGLRSRFGGEWAEKQKKKRTPTLATLLQYAHDHGHLRNENFSAWDETASIRARYRLGNEKIQERRKKGLDSIQYEESDIQITDADRDWEYVLRQIKYLPQKRNDYAHGSSSLHKTVVGTFRVVSEILNQIYAR